MTRPSYRDILWQYHTVLIFLISPNTNLTPSFPPTPTPTPILLPTHSYSPSSSLPFAPAPYLPCPKIDALLK